jgi:hypothetical protein
MLAKQEALAAQAQAQRETDFVADVISEFSHPTSDGDGERVFTFFSWCCFLHHGQLFTDVVDHARAFQLFTKQHQQNLNEHEVKLLLQGFCDASPLFHDDKHKLHKLITHYEKRHMSIFDVAEFENARRSRHLAVGLLFDAQLINAAYDFSSALRCVFRHYTSAETAGSSRECDRAGRPVAAGKITLRNIAKFLAAIGALPKGIVLAELVEVAQQFLVVRSDTVLT